MHEDRIIRIRESQQENGLYILYWMQQSQRVSFNHALLEAIQLANIKQLPVLVLFTLTFDYLGANLRHYTFMLEGLKEVSEALESLGITFEIIVGNAPEVLPKYIKNAHTLVMDYGYLKPQKTWRSLIYEDMKKNNPKVGLVVLESDCIVPVKKVYNKLAYGAYVLRPHLMNKIPLYRDFKGLPKVMNQKRVNIKDAITLKDLWKKLLDAPIDQSVKPYETFKGGYQEALKKLNYFLKEKLAHYDQRSDPSLEVQSYMSMYLHFGQISSLELYEIVTELFEFGQIEPKHYDAFIEQLVVRRELAYHFVTYNPNYDQFEKMTEPWAYETIARHQEDIRMYEYNLEELEQGLTYDPYFNSAAKEMRITGFMANYMRMYWAKKIMEWSPTMKEAYERITYLNNKYFIDGRDANSYVNIAWCFGKMDRAFTERAIFGKLRYMNQAGLKRKFNIDQYVFRIEKLKE